ncbi:MAG: rRNA maturation RNase YbeY [Actinomycetota bacterium]|nr:rRNA maturation RNase YbeY [Actinomycetota bacterium]
MEVFIANEQELSVDEPSLSSLARHVLDKEGLDESAELSILLIGADHIRRLNARFAGNDYATDVLSFPMMDDEEANESMLGDVVLCPEIARANAEKLNHSLDRELNVLLVHGILHLLGYDHQGKTDQSEMERRLTEILESYVPTTT